MNWYYIDENNQQVGPVSEAEFQNLVNNGTIDTNTKVWNEGLSNWVRYWDIIAGVNPTPPEVPVEPEPEEIKSKTNYEVKSLEDDDTNPGFLTVAAQKQEPQSQNSQNQNPSHALCVVCAKHFSTEQMLKYGADYVCRRCETAYHENKRKQQVEASQNFEQVNSGHYAGIGARMLSHTIDSCFLMVAGFIIAVVLAILYRTPEVFVKSQIYLPLICFAIAIGILYYVASWAIWGATPGKIVLKMKIVRSEDSGEIGWGYSILRYILLNLFLILPSFFAVIVAIIIGCLTGNVVIYTIVYTLSYLGILFYFISNASTDPKKLMIYDRWLGLEVINIKDESP